MVGVAGLRVGRVDLLRRTITVNETMAEVEGMLTPSGVKSEAGRRTLELPSIPRRSPGRALHARGSQCDSAGRLVFTAPAGGPVRATNFRSRVWAPALRAAQLDDEGLTFHHLRHSAIGFLIDANAWSAVMQQGLGHSSIRTTLDVYGHVLPSTDRAATAHLQRLFGRSSANIVAR